MVFRHEFKHYINLADAMIIKNNLRLIARSDTNAGPDGKYRIRSLYFETPDDKILREKLEGINSREKFRIRYYNDDTNFIKLEKKTKINGFGNKISAPITKEECEKLLIGEIEWMRNSGDALIIELYVKMKFQQLKPKTIVDYYREPFVYKPGNVRITIDSQIETGINSKDFFSLNLPTVRINAESIIILEVKYDAFLPNVIRDLIQVKNRKATAFSKYAMCRIYG